MHSYEKMTRKINRLTTENIKTLELPLVLRKFLFVYSELLTKAQLCQEALQHVAQGL